MSAAGTDIAVIGMAGRFPKARTVTQFWRNLVEGVESVSFFPEDPGFPTNIASGKYVPARAVVEGIDLFDPAFFGYSPAEASVMDPQQRLFLECSWEALEDAGYDPGAYPGAISVYAGSTTNTYLLTQFSPQDLPRVLNDFQTVISNDKDFLVTRISYKLNLRGPAVNVQSACSTSLVAVHLACQSLLTGESDMALAGGVCLRLPQGLGYWHQSGGIFSSDGRCRAFDKQADGTFPGNGLGIVVLRRLADAERDGDHVYAVVKGTAINNDGSAKAGFTAPSVAGQSSVIAEAMAIGGVSPEDIQYVETHGTGTSLGDPIEIAALTQAFQAVSGGEVRCAIGSIKPNVGHLDAAAGIAGFMKAALALKNKAIPPSLHFENPNPDIDFASTPFFVNRALSEWKSNGKLRHAGVSSFGIGGTNAHAVLEEAPRLVRERSGPEDCLLVLSARTSAQLTTAITNLAVYLKDHQDLNLGDVAYTLQTGRRAFGHRAILDARSMGIAVVRLAEQKAEHLIVSTVASNPKLVLFLSADGEPQSRAIKELYEKEPVFREELDKALATAGLTFQKITSPDQPLAADTKTRVAFSVSYALAQMWLRAGVSPQLLAGDRTGECIAACVAGVLSLEDALTLALHRNSPGKDTKYFSARPTETPRIPIYSLFRGAEVSDEYWGMEHGQDLPKEENLNGILNLPEVVVLEAGTSSQISAMLSRRAEVERRTMISSFPADSQASAATHLWLSRGRLWLAGIAMDWRKCHHVKRYRVPLPTYPFERQKCWIGPPDSARVLPKIEIGTAITGDVRHPRPNLATPYQPPQTEVEKRLVALWEELLGIEGVGIADDFFELGGHSLIAVQLGSRLRETLDVEIEPQAVFQAANIVDLAAIVEQALIQQIEGMTDEEAEAMLNQTTDH
jgi:phthiocerol/phenolphthiocerol synthesis type-I polyketide synthase E